MTSPADRLQILYIDDDGHLVRLAERALSRTGFEVLHAEDAERGRVILNERHVDAIILDHHLKSGTGLDFLKTLSALPEPIPVVYVTGSDDPRVAVDALKAGAADYVIKFVGDEFMPLLINALQQAIENAALKRARAHSERAIVAAKERAEILLTEVNHRVSNSLTLVTSLIRLQASSSRSDEVKAALSETQARIMAIGNIHRSLYTSHDVSRVDVGTYVSTLLTELSSTMQHDGGRLAVTARVDSLMLPTDRAISIGVIITELVTNAFKYAYGPQGGEIRVTLLRTSPAEAVLSVEDDGVGWRADGPSKGTGIGGKIIGAMAASLSTQVEFRLLDPGTKAEMRFSTQT